MKGPATCRASTHSYFKYIKVTKREKKKLLNLSLEHFGEIFLYFL